MRLRDFLEIMKISVSALHDILSEVMQIHNNDKKCRSERDDISKNQGLQSCQEKGNFPGSNFGSVTCTEYCVHEKQQTKG